MHEKLKIWNSSTSWQDAEALWEKGAQEACEKKSIKRLSTLPFMPGIAEKHLLFKSLLYLIKHDTHSLFPRYVFKHPFKYAARWLFSLAKKKSHTREGDFFFYNLRSVEDFQKELLAQDALLVVGFSYCHKPFECPSGRFTDHCQHDAEHPVCRQCFIGKAMHALPQKEYYFPLFIPTVHYIGEKMFELSERFPRKKIFFLITACEMTLEMFGSWGNMLGLRGIGVRLDGRICNTMKAFELSERGIKPGLTVVLEPTQKRMLDII
ncbi:MAG TPA: hypothetical protein VGJ00_06060, partial [Rhabdochlamydiaceae bacterium]